MLKQLVHTNTKIAFNLYQTVVSTILSQSRDNSRLQVV